MDSDAAVITGPRVCRAATREAILDGLDVADVTA